MSYFVLKDNFKKIADVKSILLQGIEDVDFKPLISVAIPTYKRPDILQTALDSVLKQEGFEDYEVVIIDNDSCPASETEVLLRQYNDKRIRYYKNERNVGMINNWNRAIELCKGEWMTILHDDDALYPQFLSIMYNALCRHSPDLLSCYCQCGKLLAFPSHIAEKTIGVYEIKQSKCLLTNISPFPGILFKKSCAEAIGGFNEEFFPIADYVFWTNYCMRYKGLMLEKVLAFYRIGTISTSNKVYIDIINKSISFKDDLGRRMNLPGIYKKLLKNVGMHILIGEYIEYDVENKIAKETGYKSSGINNPIVRKAYGAAFRGLYNITRVI